MQKKLATNQNPEHILCTTQRKLIVWPEPVFRGEFSGSVPNFTTQAQSCDTSCRLGLILLRKRGSTFPCKARQLTATLKNQTTTLEHGRFKHHPA
jgi:hypothetical protein